MKSDLMHATARFDTARSKCLETPASGSLGKPFGEPWFDPALWGFNESGDLHGTIPEGLGPEGYRGIVHGGAIAALLDSAMTHCLFGRDVMALTAEIKVKYHRPLPVGQEVRICAKLEATVGGQIYRLTASISSGDELKAEASGTFFRPPGDRKPV